jgi:hypothetical protein
MNTRALPAIGEHRYYVLAAVGVIAVVLVGFSIDIDLLSDPSRLSVLVRLHGLVMFSWIGLFFGQTVLVARGRVDLHRRLGMIGALLAGLIVVLNTMVLIVAGRLGRGHMPTGIAKPLFLAVGLFDLATFAVLVSSALLLRRRSDWHKRLMLLAAILLLDAALARFIAAYTSWSIDSSTLRDLLMLSCIVIDTLRYRQLHPAFVVGGLLVLGNDFAARWLAGTLAWTSLVTRLLA